MKEPTIKSVEQLEQVNDQLLKKVYKSAKEIKKDLVNIGYEIQECGSGPDVGERYILAVYNDTWYEIVYYRIYGELRILRIGEDC